MRARGRYGSRWRRRACSFLAATGLLAGPCTVAAAEQAALRLDVFPYLAPTRLEAIFAPLAATLSKHLERPVVYRSAASFGDFARRLEAGEYDLAFVQPFDYVNAASSAGYLPLARSSDPLLATFVAREPGTGRSLEDFEGTRIGVPPPTAAISILARQTIASSGLRPGEDVSLVHLSSHDACLQALLIGDVDLCATAPLPLRLFERKMKLRLHEVARSREIPGSLFVASPNVPEPVREAIRAHLLEPSLSQRVPFFHSGLSRASDREYDPVRKSPSPPTGGRKTGETLRLGVLPSTPTWQLEALFAPLALALSQHLETPVQIRTSRTYARFLANLEAGSYDLALVQPFHYVEVSDLYRPLASPVDPLRGVFVVRAEGPIERLEDLRGGTLTLPPPDAAVSRLGRCHLRAAGLDPAADLRLQPVGDAASCLELLAVGRSDACLVANSLLHLVPLPAGLTTRTIATTHPMQAGALVAHQSLAPALASASADVLLHWEKIFDEDPPPVLVLSGPFAPVTEVEYEPVREAAKTRDGCPAAQTASAREAAG